MKDKMIDKIKKLLALSENNPNEVEAQAALLKAQELLLQHKIDMKEVTSEEKIAVTEKVTQESANTTWARALAQIIAKNFRCIEFYRCRRNDKKVVFLGEEDEAFIARNLYDSAVTWLNKSACRYATNMRNKHGIVKGVKQDYIIGFLQGLDAKFKEQIKTNNAFALVAVVPQEVRDNYNSREMQSVSLSYNINTHGSAEAMQAGYTAGKSFSTNQIKEG